MPAANHRCILVWDELKKKKGIPFGRQWAGRLEEKDLFPKRVQVGQNRVGWFEDEIDAWLAALPRGALPQKADLGPKPRPAPEPEPEEVDLLRQIAAKHGLDLVPKRLDRRRRGGSPP